MIFSLSANRNNVSFGFLPCLDVCSLEPLGVYFLVEGLILDRDGNEFKVIQKTVTLMESGTCSLDGCASAATPPSLLHASVKCSRSRGHSGLFNSDR